ncbi:MAG: hypothetical protein HOB82_01335 [Alphaproteobacteria bacterium]|nr:hypothetical protein [Alphaproteobacteria bacterium]
MGLPPIGAKEVRTGLQIMLEASSLKSLQTLHAPARKVREPCGVSMLDPFQRLSPAHQFVRCKKFPLKTLAKIRDAAGGPKPATLAKKRAVAKLTHWQIGGLVLANTINTKPVERVDQVLRPIAA